jgi:hypothetical protein
MKAVGVFLLVFVTVYIVSWTISYVWFMGLDFRYYFKALKFAWTSPGETAVFIQILAIVLTVFAMLVLLLWWWKRGE